MMITPAQIDWHHDEQGNEVPFSVQFGDGYYSSLGGLAESRYVFVEHNHLPNRLEHLLQDHSQHSVFTIAELGFGTGLNFLVTWQLWHDLQKHHTCTAQADIKSPQLHYISFEKYPLNKPDLKRSLESWKTKEPALATIMDSLIDAYPTLVAGCHRMHFRKDNLTLDLWFGDAQESLKKLVPLANIDAWFLDGFAPSRNQELWAEQIFAQIDRLSLATSTIATFSSAGIVKRGLQTIGFDIAKAKGFGHKRQMLTAQRCQSTDTLPTPSQDNAIVIGAGISGLMSAWSLANRGWHVRLIDKIAPLSGASGNPRAVLAPKMTPIDHVHEHLHSIGYLYSSRLFTQLSSDDEPPILETKGVLDLLLKANITTDKIAHYPLDFAQVLDNTEAQDLTGLSQQDLTNNQLVSQGGLINPQALAQRILHHHNIIFEQHDITHIDERDDSVIITTSHQNVLEADHIVICLADKSHQLDQRIFDFRKIRGQISWFTPTAEQYKNLPKVPLKYNGYCATFVDYHKENLPQFLLGASFVRNDTDLCVREQEHQQNLDKLMTAIPELQNFVPNDTSQWHARVGIRSQTPDYNPLVGRLGDSTRVWTLSGMGAKGYAFAPICAEVLADQMTQQIPALSETMLAKLSPNRQRLKSS